MWLTLVCQSTSQSTLTFCIFLHSLSLSRPPFLLCVWCPLPSLNHIHHNSAHLHLTHSLSSYRHVSIFLCFIPPSSSLSVPFPFFIHSLSPPIDLSVFLAVLVLFTLLSLFSHLPLGCEWLLPRGPVGGMVALGQAPGLAALLWGIVSSQGMWMDEGRWRQSG